MKRRCSFIAESKDGRKAIYIDDENKAQILEYINRSKRHHKKFRYIVEVLLSGMKISELYGREEINSSCKGVTAMKFFKGQENDRLYCKEVTTENKIFVIIVAELLEKKKSEKISQREESSIERVASYEYEI